ncbi:MAG: hypothetical protein OXH69_04215 [Acidobacteria bacterium]|nr:hypothetical protein [Acidobacteriota bacterium]
MSDWLLRIWRTSTARSPRAAAGGFVMGAVATALVLDVWWNEERHLRSAQRDSLEVELDRTEHERDSLQAELDRTARDGDPLLQKLSPRGPEQLNVLIFNAIRDTPVRPRIDSEFYWTVNQLKRVLNDCSLDAREYWIGRYPEQRTQVYFQGVRAEEAATEIADLLPGNQDVDSLANTDLWGIHADRDVVVLLGRDAWRIREELMDAENRPCPRLVGQPATG